MYRRQSVKRTLVNSVSELDTIHTGRMHNPTLVELLLISRPVAGDVSSRDIGNQCGVYRGP